MDAANPFAGSILQVPSDQPGRAKLLGLPIGGNEASWIETSQIPGMWYVNSYWHVPTNLRRMGERPGGLNGYEAVPCIAPKGQALHDHQARSVGFLLDYDEWDQGKILAADPGAGKTPISLQALERQGLLSEKGIIVGLSASTSAWCGARSDAATWFGLSVEPLEGTEQLDYAKLVRHKHLYIHYGILAAWQAQLVAFAPRWIIFDESHKILHSSARAKACHELSLCPTIYVRYLLTGTPLPRDLLSYYHQLAVAQPHQWQPGGKFSAFDFGVRYCGGQRQHAWLGGHMEYAGPTHELELRARLAGVHLRYTDKVFEAQLPRTSYISVPIDIRTSPHAGAYFAAQESLQLWLKTLGKPGVAEDDAPAKLTSITFGGVELKLKAVDKSRQGLRLKVIAETRRVLGLAKVDWLRSALPQLLREHTKLVVFTWLQDTAAAVCQALRDGADTGALSEVLICGPVTGLIDQPQRNAVARAFADHAGSAVFVGTMESSGISINELGEAGATAVVMLALHWTPDVMHQATLRVKRMNNKASAVQIYLPIARGTVDDHVLEVMLEHARADQSLTEACTTGGMQLVGALQTESDRERASLASFLTKMAAAEAQLAS